MTANRVGTCGADDNQAQVGHLVPEPQAFYSTESGRDPLPEPGVAPPCKVGSNGGGQPPAVAMSICENQRGEIVTGDVSHAVSSGGGEPGSGYPCVAHALTSSHASEDGTGRGTPLTLEVRGRDGERVLEWRDDGAANALRQPNGGRDGLGVGAICMATGQANAEIVSEGEPSLTTNHDGPPICMAPSFSKRPGQQIATRDDGSSFAVTTGEPPRLAGAEMAVRRLTPRECERLQGMPDDHTLIDWKGKPAPDGKRYAAIGNSMAVNVMRFIGERIEVVEGLSI